MSESASPPVSIASPGGRLVLASASPRRAELLRTAGIAFDMLSAEVDESIQPGETADVLVRRLAEAKAKAVLPHAAGRPVLAADTIVAVEDAVLGKPRDAAHAATMLRMLSGRQHRVLTGVALMSGGTLSTLPRGAPRPASVRMVKVATTLVEMAPLSRDEIDWYISTGEPLDKAGGYAIQGLGSRFIARVDGSYANVVGLPVALVYAMLREAGL
ncbi:MAG: nucleoside triphosphate pyrophosphatase [Vicinamibacterales bacterium]